MRRLLVAFTLVVALVALAPAAAARAQSPADAAQSALDWLRTQQQPDGSFPGFGPGDTVDAVLAFSAAGVDPASLSQGGKTPGDFLQAQADYATSSVGAAAKLAMGAVALGENPRQFANSDLLALIGQSYDATSGQYGPDVYGHALAMLAIKAAQATPPPAAIQRLRDLQLPDGGWSFDGTAATGSDTNTSGLAIQALAGAAATDPAIQPALAYLQSQQNDDGGFPYSQTSSFGNASDANSTAAAIQALIAAGADPTDAMWAKGGNTPFDALAGLQNDSGALRYQAAQAEDNALATYQAIPALLGKTLPLTTRQVAGAQAAVAPAGGAQPAAGQPAAQLPSTGAADGPDTIVLAILALAAILGGMRLRRQA